MQCIDLFTTTPLTLATSLALDRLKNAEVWSKLPLDGLCAPFAHPALVLMLDGRAELWRHRQHRARSRPTSSPPWLIPR